MKAAVPIRAGSAPSPETRGGEWYRMNGEAHMSREAATERLWAILEGVATRYPAMPLDTVKGLMTVGELHVATEILCDNLSEESRTLEPTLHDKLVSVCQLLGLDASYWGDLRERE
jgi:hypothetical protein